MWGCMFSAYPFLLWWLREYIYFVLLSSSNRKYELLPIVYDYTILSAVCLSIFFWSRAMKSHAPRSPWLLSIYQHHTQLLKDPTVATAQRPKTRHLCLSLMFRIVTGKVAVPVEDTILLHSGTRTCSNHKHKYRHLITNCEQYRHPFFVRTVPEPNLLPAACIKANHYWSFSALMQWSYSAFLIGWNASAGQGWLQLKVQHVWT